MNKTITKEDINQWVNANIENYKPINKNIGYTIGNALDDMIDDFKSQVLNISRNDSFGNESYMEKLILKHLK